MELKTYGELKKLIKLISLKQKGEKIISQGKELALDQLLGLIPGASNAKTALDFLTSAFKKPDTVKTNTWLDKLDIDDADYMPRGGWRYSGSIKPNFLKKVIK
jgi:hypothetical protein